jgi:hypothetical protein
MSCDIPENVVSKTRARAVSVSGFGVGISTDVSAFPQCTGLFPRDAVRESGVRGASILLARSGQSGVFFEGGIKSFDPEHRLHTASSLLD